VLVFDEDAMCCFTRVFIGLKMITSTDSIGNVRHGLHTARCTGLATGAILSANDVFKPNPMIDNI